MFLHTYCTLYVYKKFQKCRDAFFQSKTEERGLYEMYTVRTVHTKYMSYINKCLTWLCAFFFFVLMILHEMATDLFVS